MKDSVAVLRDHCARGLVLTFITCSSLADNGRNLSRGCDDPVSLAHFLALEKGKAFVGLYVCKSAVFT